MALVQLVEQYDPQREKRLHLTSLASKPYGLLSWLPFGQHTRYYTRRDLATKLYSTKCTFQRNPLKFSSALRTRDSLDSSHFTLIPVSMDNCAHCLPTMVPGCTKSS